VWALEEASYRNAIVDVVTAYLPSYVPATSDLSYVPLDSFDLVSEVERMQSAVVESALKTAEQPRVEVRKSLVKGRPAETLLKLAKGAELLVVGNRGRGGFVGLRLGSVSQAISHHCPCPLVIVRTGVSDEI